MGVVKNQKSKTKKDLKNLENGKPKKDKVKKKISCLQCIRSPSEDGGLEGKYRVAAPELMQDTFMSDSEDEGGEVECPIQQQQQYRYMNSEGTLPRARPLEDSVTDGHLWPSNNDQKVATIERQPLDIGFLVSFVVDARGGAMKAKRRGGVRVIVPPAACAAPTRVTCRAATRRAPAAAPPPLMEGEALASRLLELQPQGAKFLAPVIIEVPIFTTSCPEREIVILRSDSGETWQDHYLHNNDNPMIQEALHRERLEHGTSGETLGENGERVTRIITCDFPHYLAVVSRVRQEVHIIGPEGGAVSSGHIPQVQALFPPAALTKRIRVGVQAHGAPPALRRRALPRHAAVAPVITVEPRRRKFHRSITLTSPLPQPESGHEKQPTSTLRLLCSIMGGQARAVWEDVTGSTPLTLTGDTASFTTTVSARFWLMNCQNVGDATKLATELYKEMLLVPFEVRIVVLGKRLDTLEGRLLVLYITDRYAYETLLQQEHYVELAHSTSVRLLDGRAVYLEFSGNLLPVTKSGEQPVLIFEAFKDNRVEFPVRVKHHEEPAAGRVYFMNEPKAGRGEAARAPACVLDAALPERVAPRAHKSLADHLNLDQSGFDALKDELSFHWDHHHSLGPIAPPPPPPPVNGHDTIITNGDAKYTVKDEDQLDDTITKQQPNGNTIHVDSNKVKATFDSDEDKTPMNTLEKTDKGKKKEGFLGGLADKVKHVFSHSQDEDDSKDSPKAKSRESKEKSPSKKKEKSPPKDSKDKSPTKETKEKTPPKEAKEKTPPKPAPRIISEDLLDKVDDMFKDLKSKPHQKDKEEDLNSEVYTTKLVVDEDRSPGLLNITEEVYEQYANMQPVETPLRVSKKDPFAYPTICCEGKNGPKHSHEETSTLLDQAEQIKFAAHEKMHDVGDNVQGHLEDEAAKLSHDKEKLQRQASELQDDLWNEGDKIKNDLFIKEHDLIESAKNQANDVKHAVDDGLNKLSESTQKTQGNINAKAADIQSNIANQFDNVKTSGNDAYDHFAATVGETQNNLTSKAHELDFAAMEKAEELKNRGHDTAENLKQKAHNVESDLKNEARASANAVSDSYHAVQDNLNHNAQDIKAGAKETVDNIKDKTNEKLNDLNDSIDNAKEKAQDAASDLKSKAGKEKDKAKKEAKKAKKEGKSFITGLVHNIFGEKEKIENDVKSKIADGKDEANDLLKQASAKKDEIKDGVGKKTEELKEGANRLAENVNDKAKDAEKTLHDKKDELEKAAHDKKAEVSNAIHDTNDQVKKTVQDKTKEVSDAIQSKTQEASQAIHDKKDQITGAVHDTTEHVGNAIHDKKEELGKAIHDKKQEVGQAIHDKTQEVGQAIHNKTQEVGQAIHNKTQEIGNKAHEFGNAVHDQTQEVSNAVHDKAHEVSSAIHDKKESVQQSIHDKSEEAKHALENKVTEVGNAFHDKKVSIESAMHDKKAQAQNAAETELDRIRQTAEQTTDEIKKSAEDAINATADKKSELQSNLSNKFTDLQNQGQDNLDHVQNIASDKVGDLQQASRNAFDHAQDSALSTFDRFESSAKDKVGESKDTWEDLHSSTRDTYADYRDDVHGLESSAQDTLHSFQSSAGNTFDSLDDSAKEFLGGVQSSTQSFENNSKELFGDVKDSFEGFQVSADNRLEDVKGEAKERLGEASERLEGVQEAAKGAEKAVADTLASEADTFTSSLNDLGNSVFGASSKGFMKDSSTKLLESEKSQSSPSPQKKTSGIPKLKNKRRK